MSPRVALPAGVEPLAVVVGTAPTVPVLALADLTAVMPSIPERVRAEVFVPHEPHERVFDAARLANGVIASDHAAACARLAPGRPSGWPPVVGADAPQRPVLCIQSMTAGAARFAEGRRAGLLEAAAMLRGAAGLLGGSTGANALRCGAEEIEALVARTGGA